VNNFVANVTVAASVFTLVAISIDRWVRFHQFTPLQCTLPHTSSPSFMVVTISPSRKFSVVLSYLHDVQQFVINRVDPLLPHTFLL
jgi:hypothetical protein